MRVGMLKLIGGIYTAYMYTSKQPNVCEEVNAHLNLCFSASLPVVEPTSRQTNFFA